MKRAHPIIAAALLLLSFAPTFSPAFGYLLSYEGDVFPEEDGWAVTGNPEDPARYSRSIEDGILAIDATANGVATVRYEQYLTLPSDNTFCEWRSRTSNNDGYSKMAFLYGEPGAWRSTVITWHADYGYAYLPKPDAEEFAIVPLEFAPSVFHVFRMIFTGTGQTLSLDGEIVAESQVGAWSDSTMYYMWGFTKQRDNMPTRSQWDYVCAGVVPEPSAALLVLLATALFRRRR